MKLRPTRSARRALRSYLTAVTFRQHFPATLKIIRLLNKRGFAFRSLRLVWRWFSRRCSGVTRCRKVVCRGGKRVGRASDTRIRGRIIHRLLFRRSKHRKQVRQIAQQRKKRKFKLGWISGLLQLATTNRGSRPEIQDDPGGRGERGKRETTMNSSSPTKNSTPCRRRTSAEINFRREMVTSENTKPSVSRGGKKTITRSRDSASRRKS